jgi:hypothetical protein
MSGAIHLNPTRPTDVDDTDLTTLTEIVRRQVRVGWQGTAGLYGSTWTPARDSFRYYGARVDVKF